MKIDPTLLREANIPQAYWLKDFSTFTGSDETRELCKQYLINRNLNYKNGIGLFFRGDARNCKTFLATYVLKILLYYGYSGYYITHDTFLQMAVDHEVLSEIWHNVRHMQFLVFDDFDYNADLRLYKKALVMRLVKDRLDSGKPLICCSRHTVKQLGQLYDARLERYLQDTLILVENLSLGFKQHLVNAQLREKGIE
jgi:hypothetical protein